MSFKARHMTHSQQLRVLVLEDEISGDHQISCCCDMTSGDDGDCSAREHVDDAIDMMRDALAYDPNATIFWAMGDDSGGDATTYYLFGKDEDDAIRRLTYMLEKIS